MVRMSTSLSQKFNNLQFQIHWIFNRLCINEALTSSALLSSHHFPPAVSSPPFKVCLASSIVSASRRSCPAMKEPFCGSPVHVLMSMISSDWLRSVSRLDSCGRESGFSICNGYEGSERGGGRVGRRNAMSCSNDDHQDT